MSVKTHNIKNKESIIFWQKLFIYFWIFSLIGHYFELLWKNLIHLQNWHSIMSTFLPLSPPYGIGVVAIILLIEPLIKKYKLNCSIIFILCTIISSLVEYLCSVFLVLLVGYNKFWNYSYESFNINGHIFLQNEIIFGILSTLFLYFIYPFTNLFFQKLSKHQLNTVFWFLFLSFILNLTTLNLK